MKKPVVIPPAGRAVEPVVGPAERAPQPVVSPSAQRGSTWTFSLQYWRQIKYFGLTDLPGSWFIDLLDGLRDAASHLEALTDGDPARRRSFHFHHVIWKNAKVTIRRTDLNWLPKDILANEAEFPMHELSLGKGHFRVVGYWLGEERVFYVVLIDPHHNIHRAAGYESGQHCEEQLGVHHQLSHAVEELSAKLREDHRCITAKCDVHSLLKAIRDSYTLKGQIYVSPDLIDAALEHIRNGRATSFEDVFASGVLVHGSPTYQVTSGS